MQQLQEQQECVLCGNLVKNHQQVEIIDNKERIRSSIALIVH
jgi:hypothetical protein